jgi:exodeoxyribonuclease VII large subunit
MIEVTPPEPPILSVAEFTQEIKIYLESAFPMVWIQGEVSNCKLHSSGHLYLSLKDNFAQIAAVMYRTEASRLKTLPKDGDQIIVRGELNIYVQGGKYQLILKELRLAGLGELLQRLEDLKIKLNKKGYFKKEHKKPIPKMPKRIGVVTSPTGAAIHDMLHILTRRFSGFHLILNPVKVQGEGAAQEIAQAIQQFNKYDLADVLIVGRGGGSIEDLWAFNEEIVADAIYHSEIPIISAVGHETDHCIADYVADLRAPTPSAAAELVMAEKDHQLKHLAQIQHRMQQTLRHLIRHQKQLLTGILRHPFFQTPYALLGPWMQKVDDLRDSFDHLILKKAQYLKLMLEARQKHLEAVKPSAQISYTRHKLQAIDKSLRSLLVTKIAGWKKTLQHLQSGCWKAWEVHQKNRHRLFQADLKKKQLNLSIQKIFELRQERLKKIIHSLQSVNPKSLLSKGYAIVFAEKDRSVITSVSNVKAQQKLKVLLFDGEISTTVNSIEKK